VALVGFNVLRQRDVLSSLEATTTTTVAKGNEASNQAHHQKQQRLGSTLLRARDEPLSGGVQWLNSEAFPDDIDFFSASWYMNVDRFAQVDVSPENLANVEAGCFGAFRNRQELIRMSLDWLDFSVEHMSKWWRVLGCPEDPAAWNATVEMFSSYAQHHQAPFPESSLLQPTLALIAFQPYRSVVEEDDSEGDRGRKKTGGLLRKDHTLTISSLGATLASLIQVGMGRIVVIGYESTDEEIVHDTFRWLRLKNDGGSIASASDGEPPAPSFRIHNSELAYVQASDDLVASEFIEVNMPRAALAGLMKALEGSDPSWTQRWLGHDGVSSRWKYVYLTEPDTILQTRPSTIRSIKSALDAGHILVPHRFQPIPHRDDATLSRIPHLVPSSFKAPFVLESGNIVETVDGSRGGKRTGPETLGACCDAQEGDYKPGKSGMEYCGDFWWQCGYRDGNHSRLSGYELLRLNRGTGIITLAGNEHGRRCVPAPAGSCRIIRHRRQ
jgi:hypothetical protein